MMGILVFSDKVIAEEDAKRIRRRLRMTKVERIIEEEMQQAVKTAEEGRAKAESRADKAEEGRAKAEMELARYKAVYGELV